MKKIKTGEFCFQFGDDEPIVVNDVFDNGTTELTLAQSDSEPSPAIEFNDGKGKIFKLFIKPKP